MSLSFGVGRYQPHTAAEVFANQYGDCKDKHTLLASMLKAAGIPSDAVLIPSARKLDPSMPSPSQFDHVITAVPHGKDLIWMDATDGSRAVPPARLAAARINPRCSFRPTAPAKSSKRQPTRRFLPRSTWKSTAR